MPKINIITQLATFFVFAIALNMLNLKASSLIFVALLLALSFVKNHQFYRFTRRLRWFYLVMFVIFALNTPGEHLAGWPFSISPTYEGLRAGLAQLLSISMMLAALSVLLSTNSRQQLISGFYFLLSPLKCLDLDVERFAGRLWLTLHYVETQQIAPKNLHILSNLRESLANIFSQTQHDNVEIILEKLRFAWLDVVLITLMLALVMFLLLKVLA